MTRWRLSAAMGAVLAAWAWTIGGAFYLIPAAIDVTLAKQAARYIGTPHVVLMPNGGKHVVWDACLIESHQGSTRIKRHHGRTIQGSNIVVYPFTYGDSDD